MQNLQTGKVSKKLFSPSLNPSTGSCYFVSFPLDKGKMGRSRKPESKQVSGKEVSGTAVFKS